MTLSDFELNKAIIIIYTGRLPTIKARVFKYWPCTCTTTMTIHQGQIKIRLFLQMPSLSEINLLFVVCLTKNIQMKNKMNNKIFWELFNSLFNDHGLNKPSGMCIRSYNVKLKKCCIDKEFLYTEKYSHAFYFCLFLPCCQYANLRLMNLRILM